MTKAIFQITPKFITWLSTNVVPWCGVKISLENIRTASFACINKLTRTLLHIIAPRAHCIDMICAASNYQIMPIASFFMRAIRWAVCCLMLSARRPSWTRKAMATTVCITHRCQQRKRTSRKQSTLTPYLENSHLAFAYMRTRRINKKVKNSKGSRRRFWY
jgi:hypothetical protein